MARATSGEAGVGDPAGTREPHGVTMVVMLALLVIGLVTVGVDSAAASQRAQTELTTPDGAGAEVTGPDVPAADAPTTVAAGTSPSVTYGGLVWSLLDVRVVGRDHDDPFSRPVIITDVRVANTTESPLRVRESDVFVVDGEGRRHMATRFEETPESHLFVVEPGQAVKALVVFKPVSNRDPWLPDHQLEIGEPGRTPAVLPLDGEAPEVAFPEPLTVDFAGDVGRSDPDVQVTAARLDVNFGPYRAALDHHLLIVNITVTEDDDSLARTDQWSLVVGGEELRPARVETVSSTATAQRLQLVFTVASEGFTQAEVKGKDARLGLVSRDL